MITDLAAAAVAARAAAVTARLFIEINLKGITDRVLLDEFGATAAVADMAVARADQLVAAGWAAAADLERIADGWRRWAVDPDAWFSILHGEIRAHP